LVCGLRRIGIVNLKELEALYAADGPLVGLVLMYGDSECLGETFITVRTMTREPIVYFRPCGDGREFFYFELPKTWIGDVRIMEEVITDRVLSL
jgi:hypothetical protein